jgi:hypothetical protein
MQASPHCPALPCCAAWTRVALLAARPYWVELGGSVRDSGSDTLTTLTQADATEEGTVHHIKTGKVCTKQEGQPGNAAGAARAASPSSAQEEQYSVEPVITCLG